MRTWLRLGPVHSEVNYAVPHTPVGLQRRFEIVKTGFPQGEHDQNEHKSEQPALRLTQEKDGGGKHNEENISIMKEESKVK